ncbi:MAG: hypothetical protein HQ517_10315 [SAR324 cluster bacterium]|nr:hypothetical protein [SAR324 cluster bacterium]
MRKLNDILKAAKPAVPDLPMDFSERVMSAMMKIDQAISPLPILLFFGLIQIEAITG